MARAITDLAVPRRPAITTPPKTGSTAVNSKAILIASWPTTADKGKAVIVGVRVGDRIVSLIVSYYDSRIAILGTF
ncbi:hypothetical protein [Dolichospermum circinale]|uniref:hypothetical protein n=1 Tax=Dolichospermum circinale TaxID=109265 RepID=UPI00232DE6B7|nr:hypothetical protein [Dolichospermum circinale]MDB9467705.1 hypothetical protein [Dolichospermum circinale CS-539/09]